jgi:hypothetical protein
MVGATAGDPPPLPWAKLILAVGAAVLMITFARILAGHASFTHDYQTASADVIAVSQSTDCHYTPLIVVPCDTTWHATLRFMTATGQNIEVEGDWHDRLVVGDMITVRYDPDNPHDIRLGG